MSREVKQPECWMKKTDIVIIHKLSYASQDVVIDWTVLGRSDHRLRNQYIELGVEKWRAVSVEMIKKNSS